jgi:ankyrin repeat protein
LVPLKTSNTQPTAQNIPSMARANAIDSLNLNGFVHPREDISQSLIVAARSLSASELHRMLEVSRSVTFYDLRAKQDDQFGHDVLMAAAYYNLTHGADVIPLLLAYGADPHAVGKSGNTACFMATQKQPASVMRIFLDAGADISGKVANTNDSFLHTAATNPDPEVVRVLVNAQPSNGLTIDPNHLNALGNTALMVSCGLNPEPSIASTLIEAGTHLEHVNAAGHNALSMLLANTEAGERFASVFEVLMRAGATVPRSVKWLQKGTVFNTIRERRRYICKYLSGKRETTYK